MKAYVLHGINDIRYEEIPVPEPSRGEVLVQVRAAGICGSDIPRIFRTGAHRHPLIPGHEFAGEVVALGMGVEPEWLHKRVGIFPLIPCGNCEPCRQKKYEMCRNYSYLGSRRDGGFAEYAIVPEGNLLELPAEVSYEQAAMLEPMAVAAHAMRGIADDVTERIGNEHKGIEKKTVCVCGLGTIGLLLAMFLKDAGVENLLLIGNKVSQRRVLEQMGISPDRYTEFQGANTTEWISQQTNGIGVDIFFECVGKNETISLAVDCAAPAGKVVLVGNPYSDITLDKQIYWKVLRNQLVVRGTWNSSFTKDKEDDWNYVLQRLIAGSIKPENIISHRFTLDTLEQGLSIMKDKTEDYGKIMCVSNGQFGNQ